LAFQFCSRIQDILKYMYEACFPRKNKLFSFKYLDVCLIILKLSVLKLFTFSIMGDLSWKDFLSQAKQFLEISQQLGDSWMLVEKVCDLKSFHSFIY